MAGKKLEPLNIVIGQQWKEKDKRRNRVVKIVDVDDALVAYAVREGKSQGQDRFGTRVFNSSRRRFERAYRLFKDVPTAEDFGGAQVQNNFNQTGGVAINGNINPEPGIEVRHDDAPVAN